MFVQTACRGIPNTTNVAFIRFFSGVAPIVDFQVTIGRILFGADITLEGKVGVLVREFMSCSQCQELGQQANWLLIGCTRGNNQSEARSTVDRTLNYDYNS